MNIKNRRKFLEKIVEKLGGDKGISFKDITEMMCLFDRVYSVVPDQLYEEKFKDKAGHYSAAMSFFYGYIFLADIVEFLSRRIALGEISIENIKEDVDLEFLNFDTCFKTDLNQFVESCIEVIGKKAVQVALESLPQFPLIFNKTIVFIHKVENKEGDCLITRMLFTL